MEARKKLNAAESSAAVKPGAESGDVVDDAYAPRKLTLAENAILTIKVFAALGMVGAALWAFNLWIFAE